MSAKIFKLTGIAVAAATAATPAQAAEGAIVGAGTEGPFRTVTSWC